MAPGGGGEDLNAQIRRAIAIMLRKFFLVTDDEKIRLHHRVTIFVELHITGRENDTAFSAMFFFTSFELKIEFPNNKLVSERWG